VIDVHLAGGRGDHHVAVERIIVRRAVGDCSANVVLEAETLLRIKIRGRVIDRDENCVRTAAVRSQTGSPVVSDRDVIQSQVAAVGRPEDALVNESVDDYIFERDLGLSSVGAGNVDAANTRPCAATCAAATRPVDRDAAQAHGSERIEGDRRGEIDGNARRPAGENRSERPAAVNGDGFRDRQRAEAVRIECVNLAVNGRLRKGTGKGLARSSAAARVRIAACA